MNHKKVIVIPTYRRPVYTARVLSGLRSCAGIEDYTIIVNAEPGFQEVLDTVQSFQKSLPLSLFVNEKRIGCNCNVFSSLDRGFQYSDYVIIFEDDVVPAKDCLKYFEWAYKKYIDDQDVMNVCSYNKDTTSSDNYLAAYRLKWFTPWGWATWEDRWRDMAKEWDFAGARASWDSTINHIVRKDRSEIRPLLARTQNIGAELGSWVPNALWHEENQLNKFWAESVDIPDGPFFEKKLDNIPS